jgi:hypothetical protein
LVFDLFFFARACRPPSMCQFIKCTKCLCASVSWLESRLQIIYSIHRLQIIYSIHKSQPRPPPPKKKWRQNSVFFFFALH